MVERGKKFPEPLCPVWKLGKILFFLPFSLFFLLSFLSFFLFFFFAVRTFKIYFYQFQVCSPVLLTVVTMPDTEILLKKVTGAGVWPRMFAAWDADTHTGVSELGSQLPANAHPGK